MDVAALSLSIDSSSVVTAANDLDRFTAASDRAKAAVGNQSGSIAKLVAAVQSMDSKLSTIVGSLDKIARASKAAAASNDNMASSAAKAGASLAMADAHVIAYTQHLAGLASAQRMADAHVQAFQNHVSASGRAMQQADAHVQAYTEHMRQLAATKPIPADTPVMITKTGESARLASHHVSNMAYQVNDIVVSLASGQNPLMVFIQQGSQIGQIYGQSGLSLKNFSLAIVGMLAPLTPLIIAIGLAAAALAALTSQARDDSGLKKYTTAMGYTKEEVKKLNAVTVTFGDTFKAVFQVGFERIANAFGIDTDAMKKKWEGFLDFMVTATRAAIAGTYAVLTSGLYTMQAAIENAQSGKSYNPLEAIKDGVTRGYGDAQKFMDDVVKQAQANARSRQAEMAKGFYDKPSAGPDAFSFSDLLKDADKMKRGLEAARASIGLYGEELARVNYESDLFNKAADNGLKLNEAQSATVKALAADMAKLAEANRLATFREETKQAAFQQFQALKDAAAQIGVYGRDLSALRYEQEMLNKAVADHITLTDNDRQVIANAARALADKEYANIREQSRADNARWHAEQMRQLDVERGSLRLTAKELIAYNYQQELINKALEAGIAFKDIDIEKTQRQAAAYAEVRYAIDQQARAIADAREVTKGFFTDWINGAREGANVFKALGDAAVNALNRIIDKLLDKTLDGFLDNLFSGGGGGGFLSGLFGGGSMESSITKAIASNPAIFAKGAAFGAANDNAIKFAKGGMFTNSIVTSPTLFKFANGAKMGEMGEAGPEAIMPLTRGPNGKLGVQAHGGARGDIVINTPINITQEGSFTTQDAQALAAQAGQQAVQEVRRNLDAYLREWDIDGAVAA